MKTVFHTSNFTESVPALLAHRHTISALFLYPVFLYSSFLFPFILLGPLFCDLFVGTSSTSLAFHLLESANGLVNLHRTPTVAIYRYAWPDFFIVKRQCCIRLHVHACMFAKSTDSLSP